MADVGQIALMILISLHWLNDVVTIGKMGEYEPEGHVIYNLFVVKPRGAGRRRAWVCSTARFSLAGGRPGELMRAMTAPVETINIASSEIRAAFENWLVSEYRSGARLIVLEGLSGSGKTTLTKLPFSIGVGQSENIAIDQFCYYNIPKGAPYREAVNWVALRKVVRAALGSAPVVVVEGPVAWPLIEPIADAELQRDCIRRVYLKRMMLLRAKIWVDEDFLADPARWPPSDFHRSIYEYHAQRPWCDANLVLERIVDEVPRPAGMLIFGR